MPMSERLEKLVDEYLGTQIDQRTVMNEHGRTVSDLNAELIAKTTGVRVARNNVIGNTVITEEKFQPATEEKPVAEEKTLPIMEDKQRLVAVRRRLRDAVLPLVAGSLIGGPVGALVMAYLGRGDNPEPSPIVVPDNSPGEVGVEIQ